MNSEKIAERKDKKMIFKNQRDMIQIHYHLLPEERKENFNHLLVQSKMIVVQVHTTKAKWFKNRLKV